MIPKPNGARTKSALGINVKTLTPELAKSFGLEGARGAFVVSVDPGSIADENGMTADDLIVEVNNRSIAGQEDLLRATRDLKNGDDVVIKVLRKERGPLRRAWISRISCPTASSAPCCKRCCRSIVIYLPRRCSVLRLVTIHR